MISIQETQIGIGQPSGLESTVGLLLSGGLDSSILVYQLLKSGWRVQPFYIQCGLYWETAEARAVRGYLSALNRPRLKPLVVLELPLADVYGNHWSITGRGVPVAESPDSAVYLPGRNASLTIKAALWCQLHQIRRLALATLKSNPFADATPLFFQDIELALNTAQSAALRIIRPFDHLEKRQVMQLGRDAPLDLTFSCIAPNRGLHCGRCNKCVERQRAFRLVDRHDPTVYVASASESVRDQTV